ncbi:hypothetical protein FEM48_Zijuj12G0018800 [Ziziphus jujuba var. spinosa]|uniref:Uncharacterized protein n=1 Tax=Ziziphus jujuba var. spinosa TaxID=714518 RepID=A0A978UAI5_ZIZJJ|nr:hypothetical protein FEM48_Zijuj12G0018800 [Ziziphus jujuba var. spinosa]
MRFKGGDDGKATIDNFIKQTQSLPPKPKLFFYRNFQFTRSSSSSSRSKPKTPAKSGTGPAPKAPGDTKAAADRTDGRGGSAEPGEASKSGDIKAAADTQAEPSQQVHVHLLDILRKSFRFEEADTKAKERGTIGKAEAKNEAEVNGINNKYTNKFIEVIRGDHPPTPRSSFHDICCFGNYKPVPVTENNVSVHHLLHLLREKFAGSKKEETDPIKNNCWQSFRSAKELKNAGTANKSGKSSDFHTGSTDPFKINSWHSFRSGNGQQKW